MQREIQLAYNKSKNLIENADILLFRSKRFPSFGWFVSKWTFNKHSHVALAYRVDDDIHCVEFREFKRSRIYPLKEYLLTNHIIDVYRTSQILRVPYIDSPPVINGDKPHIEYQNLFFSQQVRDKIIEDAKALMGKPYGWLNIAKIVNSFVPLFRLFTHKDDINYTPKHLVCSTLIEYCYRKNWVSLTPDISDTFVTPADISNSSLTFYLFTLNEI
jgi:hypothetical protein